MNYDIQRCTRHCAASGRELMPGEVYFSVLTAKKADIVRQDYSVECWNGPPPDVLAWWKSQLPAPQVKRKQWAPSDVMLDLLEQLEPLADQQDMRDVLALLLIRRRVARVEETQHSPGEGETLVLYCPRRDTEYQVRVTTPTDDRTDQIQNDLTRLLTAGPE